MPIASNFEEYIEAIAFHQQDFASQIHDMLMQKGCKLTIKPAASGPVASYAHPANKKVIINFVFRKGGLVIRVYGDNHGEYLDFLQTMPASLRKTVAKALTCKRLAQTGDCNSRCSMGYDFIIGGEHYQKCRYNCFLFPVNEESFPYIRRLVEEELASRG